MQRKTVINIAVTVNISFVRRKNVSLEYTGKKSWILLTEILRAEIRLVEIAGETYIAHLYRKEFSYAFQAAQKFMLTKFYI